MPKIISAFRQCHEKKASVAKFDDDKFIANNAKMQFRFSPSFRAKGTTKYKELETEAEQKRLSVQKEFTALSKRMASLELELATTDFVNTLANLIVVSAEQAAVIDGHNLDNPSTVTFIIHILLKLETKVKDCCDINFSSLAELVYQQKGHTVEHIPEDKFEAWCIENQLHTTIKHYVKLTTSIVLSPLEVFCKCLEQQERYLRATQIAETAKQTSATEETVMVLDDDNARLEQMEELITKSVNDAVAKKLRDQKPPARKQKSSGGANTDSASQKKKKSSPSDTQTKNTTKQNKNTNNSNSNRKNNSNSNNRQKNNGQQKTSRDRNRATADGARRDTDDAAKKKNGHNKKKTNNNGNKK